MPNTQPQLPPPPVLLLPVLQPPVPQPVLLHPVLPQPVLQHQLQLPYKVVIN